MTDDVMTTVTALVQRGQQGERKAARHALESMWFDAGGDAFHRCVIAHFPADLQDEESAELAWDERALAAVDAVTDERAQEFGRRLQVRNFLPSLYGSVADDHRRLGDRDLAREFLDRAWAASEVLGDDAYGTHVKGVLTLKTER